MQGTTFPDRWKWIWNIDVQSTRKASPKEFIWTIASFLEVKDLLALTYCSPQSRAELTSPIYEPVWQKALNRFREEQPSRCVPLPECPPYMECWKFADLALTRRCKHCHKAISAIVMYRLPTKLCRACFAANIVPQRFVVEEILGPEERFPFSVLQGVTSILAEEACEPSYQGLYYYSPFILYYIEQYRALCRAHESFNVEDTGPRNEWVRNCKKRVRERNRIGRELVNWDLDNRQYNENYNTLFLTMGERPTPPERDEDSILPEEVVDERRASREADLLRLYRAFKIEYPEHPDRRNPFPSESKFLNMIQSRVLKELDVPDITRYWDLLLPGLKEAIGIDYVLSTEEVVGWYNRHAAAHAKAQETRVVSFTFDDLSKPKGVFGCDACNLPLWVETLVSHHHFQDSFKEQIIGDKLKSAGAFRVRFDLPRLGSLRYDPNLTRIIETILRRAPSMRELSTRELFAHKQSFECCICESEAQRPLGFGHLVLHFSDLHRDVLTERMNKARPVARLLAPDVAKATWEQFTAYYLNWSPKEKRDAHARLGKEELVEGSCRHCLSEGHGGAGGGGGRAGASRNS